MRRKCEVQKNARRSVRHVNLLQKDPTFNHYTVNRCCRETHSGTKTDSKRNQVRDQHGKLRRDIQELDF